MIHLFTPCEMTTSNLWCNYESTCNLSFCLKLKLVSTLLVQKCSAYFCTNNTISGLQSEMSIDQSHPNGVACMWTGYYRDFKNKIDFNILFFD